MPLRDRARAVRRFLDRTLFPDPPQRQGTLATWEKAGLLSALFALAIIAQLARVGWTASLNSLWAEDGEVFVQGAFAHSLAHSLGAEYSGYLVLVPRLAGEAASAFPVDAAPAVVSIFAAALVALSGFVVWEASGNHLSNPYLRGTLALLTVLSPVGGLETIDSASYVSWYMLVGVFWLLLWRPRSLRGAILAGLFIALAALSNPGIWFFLPFAVLRAITIRDRRDVVIVAAYFASSLAQIFTLANSSYEAVEPVWTSDIWAVLLQRVADGMVFGLRLGGDAWSRLGWPFLIALTICLLAGLAVGFRRADARRRTFAALVVPIALLMFVLSVYQRAVGAPMLWAAGGWGSQAGRYSIVPVMLLISVAFVFIDRPARPRRQWGRGDVAIAATVALLFVSIAVSLPSRNLAARGTPPWDTALDTAATQCAANAGGTATLPISPPGFGISLPCNAIDHSDPQARR